jgi:hypothetical protein
VVSYPFHPLAGQTVLVIGDHEHDGIRHFLIRQPRGGSYQIPDWMFDPAANGLAIVSVPRLPISQLVLLRTLIDRLVTSPSKEGSTGGVDDGEVVPDTNRPVHQTSRADRIDRPRTREGGGALLQALLTEAMTKPIGQSSDAVKKEVGDE